MSSSEWEIPQHLLEEFRSGNKDAFHHIYRLNNGALWTFAYKLTGNPEEAEDIVADTFIKLWEHRHNIFETPGHIKAYLYTITRNSCIDLLKRSQITRDLQKEIIQRAELIEDEYFLQASRVKAELLNKVLGQVDNLPEAMKQIFRMVYIEELSTAEIARRLNLTEATVRVQKANAIKLLKKALRDKDLLASGIISAASLALLELMLGL